MIFLKSRICEACQFFPKLAGLSSLMPFNLKKKTEIGVIDLKETGIIGDSIKSKDVIIFDLKFYEVWVEVDMSLESEDQSYQISFELKVEMDTFKSQLENSFTKLGIQSLVQYLENDSKSNYYLFSRINVTYPKVQNKPQNLNTTSIQNNPQVDYLSCEKVDVSYDSKITCILEFIDLTELVWKEILSHDISKSYIYASSPYRQRKYAVQDFFNNFFISYLESESKKSNLLGWHGKVVWKSLGDDLLNCSYEGERHSILSQNSSSSDQMSSGEEQQKNQTFEKRHTTRIYFGTTKVSMHHHYGFTPVKNTFQHMDAASLLRKGKFDPKYSQDFNMIKNTIDYNGIISKYSGNYITTREFYLLYPPETKNLKVESEKETGKRTRIMSFLQITSEEPEDKTCKEHLIILIRKFWICIAFVMCVLILIVLFFMIKF